MNSRLFIGIDAVFVREMMILRRRFKRYVLGISVAPILYIIAFGTAVGSSLVGEQHSYLEFLLPGLVAMTTMTQSYGVATEINSARFYFHVFEEFQSAPISNTAYVLGEVLAGMTRAMIGISIILFIGYMSGVTLNLGPLFWFAAFLNAFVFSCLAVMLAMVVRGHGDLALLNNFVVTPMAFLAGTFFPLDRLPEWAQYILHVLPLTHAAQAIRAAALDGPVVWSHYGILIGGSIVVFMLALRSVDMARD